jgi:hypothetical protein
MTNGIKSYAQEFIGGLFLFIVVLLLYSFMFPSPHPPLGCSRVEFKGFSKIQPLTSLLSYKGTNFTVAFIDTLGTTTTLNKISVNETLTNKTCTISSTGIGSKIKAGGTF